MDEVIGTGWSDILLPGNQLHFGETASVSRCLSQIFYVTTVFASIVCRGVHAGRTPVRWCQKRRLLTSVVCFV